jgi:hypothetical protein
VAWWNLEELCLAEKGVDRSSLDLLLFGEAARRSAVFLAELAESASPEYANN